MGVNYKADEHQEEENTYSILDKYFSQRPAMTLTFPHRNLIQGYYLSLYYRQCGTNQIQPNRKETPIEPQVCLWGLLWVCSRSARADPELTLTKPKVNSEQTQNGHRVQTLISEADSKSRQEVWSN